MAELVVTIPQDFLDDMKKFMSSVQNVQKLVTQINQQNTQVLTQTVKIQHSASQLVTRFRRMHQIIDKTVQVMRRSIDAIVSLMGTAGKLFMHGLSLVSMAARFASGPIGWAITGAQWIIGGTVSAVIWGIGGLKWLWDKMVSLGDSILSDFLQSSGIGASVGGIRAFKTFFGFLPDDPGLFRSAQRARFNIESRQYLALRLLGVQVQRNTTDMIVAATLAAARFMKQQPKGYELYIAEAYGITTLFTPEYLVSLLNLTDKELEERAKLYDANKLKMELTSKAVKGWTDFNIQLKKAGAKILSVIGEKLADPNSDFSKSLNEVSKGLVNFMQRFLEAPITEKFIRIVIKYLMQFADWMKSEKPLKLFDQTITLLRDIFQEIKKILSHLNTLKVKLNEFAGLRPALELPEVSVSPPTVQRLPPSPRVPGVTDRPRSRFPAGVAPTAPTGPAPRAPAPTTRAPAPSTTRAPPSPPSARPTPTPAPSPAPSTQPSAPVAPAAPVTTPPTPPISAPPVRPPAPAPAPRRPWPSPETRRPWHRSGQPPAPAPSNQPIPAYRPTAPTQPYNPSSAPSSQPLPSSTGQPYNPASSPSNQPLPARPVQPYTRDVPTQPYAPVTPVRPYAPVTPTVPYNPSSAPSYQPLPTRPVTDISPSGRPRGLPFTGAPPSAVGVAPLTERQIRQSSSWQRPFSGTPPSAVGVRPLVDNQGRLSTHIPSTQRPFTGVLFDPTGVSGPIQAPAAPRPSGRPRDAPFTGAPPSAAEVPGLQGGPAGGPAVRPIGTVPAPDQGRMETQGIRGWSGTQSGPGVGGPGNARMNNYLTGVAYLETTYSGKATGRERGIFQQNTTDVRDARRLGVPNPEHLISGSPEQQYAATQEYIKRRHPDAYEAIRQGRYDDADKILNKRWVSLPGGSQATQKASRYADRKQINEGAGPRPPWEGGGKPQSTPPASGPSTTQPSTSAPSTSAPPRASPGAMKSPSGSDPSAVIIHHTSDHHTLQQNVDIWKSTRPGVGSQLYVDRDGTIHDVKAETGYGGTGHIHPRYTSQELKDRGITNDKTIGIEVVAKNDADVTPAQRKAVKEYLDKHYPNTPLYGHGEVNPGHRESDEGMSIVHDVRKDRGYPEGKDKFDPLYNPDKYKRKVPDKPAGTGGAAGVPGKPGTQAGPAVGGGRLTQERGAAGVAGQPGTPSGPPGTPGRLLQDPAGIPGLPGTPSGPRAEKPSAARQDVSPSSDLVQQTQLGDPAKTRNRPITGDVHNQLSYAAAKTGLRVEVVSGGQSKVHSPATRDKPGGWKGSTRHDDGGAADVKLYDTKDGHLLDMNNPADQQRMQEFTKQAVRAGATGVGAGMGYMGANTIHIGGGKPASWGGANWVETARKEGTGDPVSPEERQQTIQREQQRRTQAGQPPAITEKERDQYLGPARTPFGTFPQGEKPKINNYTDQDAIIEKKRTRAMYDNDPPPSSNDNDTSQGDSGGSSNDHDPSLDS